MKAYLLALGVDVLISIVNGYIFPNTSPTDHDDKKLCSCNYKARHNIFNALLPTF